MTRKVGFSRFKEPTLHTHSPSPRVLRLRQVQALTGLGRSSIYNRLNTRGASHDPTFPRPIRLSSCPGARGAIGFLESEVLAWIQARAASRNVVLTEQPLRPHNDKLGASGRRAAGKGGDCEA